MTCSFITPCGNVLAEDMATTQHLRAEGITDRTIYSCMNAHHFVVGHAPTLETIQCKFCGNAFAPNAHNQVYCSPRCHQRQYRADTEGQKRPPSPLLVKKLLTLVRTNPTAPRHWLACEVGMSERTVRRILVREGLSHAKT